MNTNNLIQEFIQIELLNDTNNCVSFDAELLLDGVLDSLGVMRLVTFIENQIGASIPAQDITVEHFHSINAITEYLQRFNGEAPS